MTGLATKIETLASLGVGNVLRVGLYRVGIKSSLHPVTRLADKSATGPFFGPVRRLPPDEAVARDDWHSGFGRAFGQTVAWEENEPPEWFWPLNGGPCANDKRPWWNIPDFDPQVGDIKKIWEASRFDWTLPMAQRAALGELGELARLNDWLNDWSEKNHPHMGVNWKCGQEASIRVMHLVAAACILGQETTPESGLVALIRVHLRRIPDSVSDEAARFTVVASIGLQGLRLVRPTLARPSWSLASGLSVCWPCRCCAPRTAECWQLISTPPSWSLPALPRRRCAWASMCFVKKPMALTNKDLEDIKAAHAKRGTPLWSASIAASRRRSRR